MTPDLVSSTIAARAREPEGLRTMLAASVAAHVVAIATVVLLPGLIGLDSKTPDTVMTISLGGAPGPVTGGMTPISSRPVQRAEPQPELPRPTPPRPPAPKPPEMVEPTKAPVRVPPRTPVRQAPEESTARTPTTGAQVKPGQGRTETGSSSTEAGLSTGGGGGTGGQINLGDFCDPQYLGQMINLIHRNWNPRQQVAGKPVVRFVIQRDGTLTEISLRQPSGYPILDLTATRAVTLTRAIPPLPACYPNPTFVVNLTFEYIRSP
jgi:TonB family protein